MNLQLGTHSSGQQSEAGILNNQGIHAGPTHLAQNRFHFLQFRLKNQRIKGKIGPGTGQVNLSDKLKKTV